MYQHVYGKYIGSHAIKILGWGYQNSTAYWLAANSWNTDWGDRGLVTVSRYSNLLFFCRFIFAGFFKILRGKDEVSIEDNVYAGIPKY